MFKDTRTGLTLISTLFLLCCIMASGLADAEDEPSSDDIVTRIYINIGETFEVNLSFGGFAPEEWKFDGYDGSYLQLLSKTTWQDPAMVGGNDSWEQMIWKFKGLKDGETQLRFNAEFREDDFHYSEIFIVTIGQGSSQLGKDNMFWEADSGSCLHFDTGEEFAMNFTWGEEDGFFFSDILFDNSTIQLLKSETFGPIGNITVAPLYYRIWTFKALQTGKTYLKFIRGDSEVYNYTIYVGTVSVTEMTEEKAPGFELPALLAVLAVVAIIGGRRIISSLHRID